MKRFIASLLVIGLLASTPAAAQGWAQSYSPGQARDAVQTGKNVPLSKIYRRLKREYGGWVLDANLFSSPNGGSEYHIDWKADDGRKMFFKVNAQTGDIIARQGK